MITRPHERIFCALDTTDEHEACKFAETLRDSIGGLKLGLEFFSANGPAGYRAVADSGLPIFLDLKLHDIPNTVAKAIRALMPLRPSILTVHTQGGASMMHAAAEAAADAATNMGVAKPAIVGVTVLTSLDGQDLARIGVPADIESQVVRLAKLAMDSGLDGVVCSPREIRAIRAAVGDDFKLVVPGIRPKGAATGDQKRVMTPADANAAGADVLVIGRPILQAADPAAAAAAIAAELDG